MKNIIHKIGLPEANVLFLFFVGVSVLVLVCRKALNKHAPTYLRLILLYIFLILFQIAFSLYFIFWGINRLSGKANPINVSGSIFIVLEYCIFSLLLSTFIKSVVIKRFLFCSCILFSLAAPILWHSDMSFAKVMSVLNLMEGLTLVPFCLYYFYELFTNPPIIKLAQEPSFWITTGILFLLICISPYYIAYGYFSKVPEMHIIDYIGYDVIILFLAKASL